jgi:diacylglycerol kinase family enzyme
MIAAMRLIVLIVNPFATRVTDARVRAVERELGRVASVRTILTERAGHATELAEAACAEADAIVVFSGDGGFNEAVNGADGVVPLGFLPGGGTSVLPRALGLSRDPVEAAAALARAVEGGRTRRIGVGRVNGRRFAFGAGLGLDAEVVRRVDALGRRADGRRPGDLTFVREVVRVLVERRGRLEPTLELEGLGRAALVLVANCEPYTYAGPVPVRLVPGASFERGLAVVAPRRVSPLALPLLLPALLAGHPPRGVLRAVDLDRLVVTSARPVPLQADGEDLGDVDRAELVAERGALTVLTQM